MLIENHIDGPYFILPMEGNMTIQSGKVSYGRVKKDDDYGINRNVVVELTFSVEGGGAQRELDAAGAMAQMKVEEMLGIAPTRTAVIQTEASGGGAKAALAAAITGEPVPVKPPRAPRQTKPKETPAASADAASMDDEVVDAMFPDPKTPASAAAEVVEEDWAAAAPEVTDVDLSTACNRTAKALSDNVPIRHLIAEFAGPPPKQLREIPQNLRAQFVARLDKLVADKAKG